MSSSARFTCGEMKDNKQMNELYGKFFKPPYPAKNDAPAEFRELAKKLLSKSPLSR